MKFKNLRKSFPNKQKLQDMKNMQSSNATAKVDMLGDQSDILTQKKRLNIASFHNNIARFPLLDFIDCCVNKQYNSIIITGVLEDINSETIQEKWIILLSQYYKARGDESNNEKNQMIFRMQELRLRASIITMLLNSVGMIYSPTLIGILKDFDPAFCEFQFLEDSIDEDLQLIKNMELANDLEYTQLKEELEAQEPIANVKSVNPEEVFYDWVASYNEVFKTSHSVAKLTTMEYANNCKRLDKYISSQESQKIE